MYCFSAASDWCSRFLLPQVIGLWRVLLPQVIESYCRKWLNLTAASDGLPVNSHEVDRMLGHLRVMCGRDIMKNYCASHIDGFLTLYDVGMLRSAMLATQNHGTRLTKLPKERQSPTVRLGPSSWSCDRVRLAANIKATSREHTSILTPPKSNENPSLRIREKYGC